MTTSGPGRDEPESAGDPRAPSTSSRPAPGGEVVLAAQPASVSAARRFVRTVLGSLDGPLLVDEAALVVTELVSNAVLHAGGPIRLSVSLSGSSQRGGTVVRLEVTDSSPVPPVVREYGTAASTGRGLTLVARLASRWGVEPAEFGKRVWVELAPDAATDVVTPPASTLAGAAADGADRLPVRFLGVPVAAYLRLQEQNDAVLRELELLAFTADHDGRIDPSPELVRIIERSRQFFNLTREGFRGEVAAAAERGESAVDLEGSSSVRQVVPAAEFVELFEQAEELAAHGELLIGPAPDDVGHLRRWFAEQLAAQLLDNRPPEPFSS